MYVGLQRNDQPMLFQRRGSVCFFKFKLCYSIAKSNTLIVNVYKTSPLIRQLTLSDQVPSYPHSTVDRPISWYPSSHTTGTILPGVVVVLLNSMLPLGIVRLLPQSAERILVYVIGVSFLLLCLRFKETAM